MAIDEDTAISNTAQMTVFIRRVTKKFEVFEELLVLTPMKNTNGGIHIFEVLKEIVEGKNLSWKKLCSTVIPHFTNSRFTKPQNYEIDY